MRLFREACTLFKQAGEGIDLNMGGENGIKWEFTTW